MAFIECNSQRQQANTIDCARFRRICVLENIVQILARVASKGNAIMYDKQQRLTTKLVRYINKSWLSQKNMCNGRLWICVAFAVARSAYDHCCAHSLIVYSSGFGHAERSVAHETVCPKIASIFCAASNDGSSRIQQMLFSRTKLIFYRG